MRSFLGFLAACLFLAALSSCSSTYYNTLEKIGFAKRDLLVQRVEKTREAQADAKEQFASALEKFLAVTKVDGGELQQKYDELNREFSRSESQAKEVRSRIEAVEDVAEALFAEWKQELGQYTNPTLRADSQQRLDTTRRRYDSLIAVMKRASVRMDPVLSTFRDQVLFLKHNLNARALASLGATHRTLEADISRLIKEMEASIKESEAFIQALKDNP